MDKYTSGASADRNGNMACWNQFKCFIFTGDNIHQFFVCSGIAIWSRSAAIFNTFALIFSSLPAAREYKIRPLSVCFFDKIHQSIVCMPLQGMALHPSPTFA